MAKPVYARCTVHDVNLDLRLRKAPNSLPDPDRGYRCPAAESRIGKDPACYWVIEIDHKEDQQ